MGVCIRGQSRVAMNSSARPDSKRLLSYLLLERLMANDFFFSAPNAFFYNPTLNLCGEDLPFTEEGRKKGDIEMDLERCLGIVIISQNDPTVRFLQIPTFFAGPANILLQAAIQRDGAAKHGAPHAHYRPRRRFLVTKAEE